MPDEVTTLPHLRALLAAIDSGAATQADALAIVALFRPVIDAYAAGRYQQTPDAMIFFTKPKPRKE